MFADLSGLPLPHVRREQLERGEALVWMIDSGEPPMVAQLEAGDVDRKRHRRKYAVGELPEDCSFYFRGPENKLNLRAQNLQIFAQIAAGVDAETWLFHLQRHDYSHWFQEQMKDDELAKEAEHIESNKTLTAEDSRAAMRSLIDKLYTAAA